VMAGHSTHPSGMVIDLLISVILYWYIWLRNIAHSSLEHGVNTLSAGQSDHDLLFSYTARRCRMPHLYKPTASLLDNRGMIYSAGNQNTSVHR
jgi:hypothetical protein